MFFLKKNIYKVILLVIFIIIVLLLVKQFFLKENIHQDDSVQQSNSLIIVETIRPKFSDSIEKLKLVGQTMANNSIDLKFMNAGIIKKIHFNTGDLVKRGDILINMDSEFLDKQIEIEEKIYKINEKKSDAVDTLFSKKSISYFEYSKYKTELLHHEKAYSELLYLKGKCSILSPIDGLIEKKIVYENTHVFPQDKIVTIHDIDKIRIIFQMNEDTYYKFKSSKQFLIEAYIQALEMTLTIKNIETSELSKDNNHFIEVEALVDNQDKKIKPGMFVSLKIIFLKTAEKINLVPKEAVFFDKNDEYYLYLYVDGIAERKNVTIGKIFNDFLEIENKLNANDEIIVASSTKLFNNAKVRKEKIT